MISEKENKKISKFLSLVLRHQPDLIEIELDENGWTSIEILILKSKQKGVEITEDILKYLVATNAKKRFAINASFNKIRANQGHSIPIDLGYSPSRPPEFLYHGTSINFVESILKNGIDKRTRHHVHLSSHLETAIDVGKRHGKPFVFKVLSGKMYDNNFEFYLSENGVWLTDTIPAIFLENNS